MHIGRQAESSLNLLLEIQVERRQGRAQAEARPANSMFCTAGYIEELAVRVGVAPSRQGTIHTGASWMWSARYWAASSIRLNLSGVVPGARSPARYRGATTSSQ